MQNRRLKFRGRAATPAAIPEGDYVAGRIQRDSSLILQVTGRRDFLIALRHGNAGCALIIYDIFHV
jgi:hypothetical protein